MKCIVVYTNIQPDEGTVTTKHRAQSENNNNPRKRVIELLARANTAEVAALWAELAPMPDYTCVRGPETGLVMIKGRIGGAGSPFNLGEATVTRATVRLSNRAIGHAHSLGTDKTKAERTAVFDAMALEAAQYEWLEEKLLTPISERLEHERKNLKAETAATKVDFFTMVRGED